MRIQRDRRPAATLVAGIAVLLGVVGEVSAAPGEGSINCREVGPPERPMPGRGVSRGPCQIPEGLQLVPGTGAGAPVMLTNFGLLWPTLTGSKYQHLCEEYLGSKVPARVSRLPDGTILVPGLDGVYASADACDVRAAEGSVRGLGAVDLAVSYPSMSNPSVAAAIWALTRDPPALHRSLDQGVSFTQTQLLPSTVRPSRVHAAAADGGRTLYVSGYDPANPLVLLASSDGGATFETRMVDPAVVGRRGTVTDLMGVHPADPRTLLLGVGSPSGADELWRSADGGASWTKVLTLRGFESLSGLVWQEAGDEVLVAGRELFRTAGEPPANLYVSRDGGLSFPEVISSGEKGPRYRCLAARGQRLYACGGAIDDDYFVGFSDDGGRTWTTVASLLDIEGPRPCAEGRCLTTSFWLCESYGASCAGLAPPESRPEARDAGGPEAGDAPGTSSPGGSDEGGCACAVGAAPRSGAVVPFIALMVTVLLARRGRRGAPGWV